MPGAVFVLASLVLAGASWGQGSAAEPPQLLHHFPGAAWREQGRQLTRLVLVLWADRNLMVLGALLWLLVSGRAADLKDWLEKRLRAARLVALAYFATVIALVFALYFPFACFQYVLCRENQLTIQNPVAFLAGSVNRTVTIVALVPCVALLAWELVRRLPTKWWRLALIAVVPINLLTGALSPVMESTSPSRKPMPASPLRDQLLRLAVKAGFPDAKLVVAKQGKRSHFPKAYVVGMGRSARIVVGSAMLRDFTSEEIEFIVAHELGHRALHHLWLDVLFSIVGSVVSVLLLYHLIGWSSRRFGPPLGFSGPEAVGSFPLWIIVIILLNVAAKPITNARSRWMESAADSYALRLTVPNTVSGAAAVSTFEKLGRRGLAYPDPPCWMKVIFWQHPPIDERIRDVEAWAARH